MSSEKLEYSASMDGQATLPTHVSTYRYAADVLQEIKTLISSSQKPSGTKLIFQTLPKHMRRRAMSHHPNRLPRKYRAAHKSQMSKSGNAPILTKRPARKYRRRSKNLLEEYLRRQRRHIWLETHIWHAKRFHMIDRWGYRLPYACCNKVYRASYRASAENCLLQDISYYCCVEIKGNLQFLRAGFSRLTSNDCGLSLIAQTYLTGRREGSIELFRDGQYPYGALQRASFMWRPLEKGCDDNQRTIWLWLHPSAANVTIDELLCVFQLKSTKNQLLQLPTDQFEQRPAKFCTFTNAFECYKHYANNDKSIELLILRDSLIRFRLTGRLSQRVLASSLRGYKQSTEANHWLAKESKDRQLLHATQVNYWTAAMRVSSPNELLSNMIMGLNVVDPRLQRRQCGRKITQVARRNTSQMLIEPPECLPISALWELSLREHISGQMLSTCDYEKLRQKHAVVPGIPCEFEQQMEPLPLLLIQRPGSQQSHYKRLGYGSGWDIIAPARYGMSLWLTLIMWGARPGGLREMESISSEGGVELFLPDTLPGKQQAALLAKERSERYFRLPPNKRCNFRKLAVVSPFKVPFAQLVRDWSLKSDAITSSTESNSFFVLRNYNILQHIDASLRHQYPFPSAQEVSDNCLIQVQLRMLSRGNLSANALICLPKSTDYKRSLYQIKRSDHLPIYTEPLLPDPNERPRRELRMAHKRMLKRLRSRRVREKRKMQKTSTKLVLIQPARTSQLVNSYLTEMRRLWLPTNAELTRNSVRRQCTREVFGYVGSGGFSFVEAAMCGIGYVTAQGLRQLVQNKSEGSSSLCLVREYNSRDYRFASFKVNLNLTMPPS